MKRELKFRGFRRGFPVLVFQPSSVEDLCGADAWLERIEPAYFLKLILVSWIHGGAIEPVLRLAVMRFVSRIYLYGSSHPAGAAQTAAVARAIMASPQLARLESLQVEREEMIAGLH